MKYTSVWSTSASSTQTIRGDSLSEQEAAINMS